MSSSLSPVRLRRRRFLLGCGGALTLATTGRARGREVIETGRRQPDLGSFDELMREVVGSLGVPGAALAVTRFGRLVYARGFGLADREQGAPVEPTSTFRIASLSKPITAAAVMQLIDRGALDGRSRVLDVLNLPEPADARWKQITTKQLLWHRGGWDRDADFDPMFRSGEIARQMNAPPPTGADLVIRYMLERPLDFEPGSKYAYSNFGYCLLGRLIESVSGQTYEQYVRDQILAPLGVRRMRLGRSLAADALPGEVRYYDAKNRTVPAVPGLAEGRVPWAYGGFSLEPMDAHGGWTATAPDLVRFASAFDDPRRSKILSEEAIADMFARPTGVDPGDASYYGAGWQVRPTGPGKQNTWHNGLLTGSTSALMVRRHDGLNWAVLLNTGRNAEGQEYAGILDPRLHVAADAVRRWPSYDLFDDLL
ncbi:serine hydrolase domain-containing protein [Alienimonas chondri]|nr:serine hydrolase domain-containing protein [Alienimonas chondri]